MQPYDKRKSWRDNLNTYKLSLIVIISLIFLISCSSQDADKTESASAAKHEVYRLAKLHYENASGEKAVTINHYDDNGVLSTAYWTTLDSSRHSYNWYTYDKFGNMVKKYREFSDSLVSTNLYAYDDNQNMIFESYERSDGVAGTAAYAYNADGKAIKAICKGLNGWFHGNITYEHDSTGSKIKGNITKDREAVGSIIYEYDEHGYMTREYWAFNQGWNQNFIYEYEKVEVSTLKSYTSSNVFITNTKEFQLVSENYDYNGETGGPSTFEYDKNGKLVKKTFTRSDDFKTETTFEYDDNGFLTKSYRNYSDGRTAEFGYEFNWNRLMTRRIFQISDGTTGIENYTYDDKMNLSKAVYKNFDGWLTGTIMFDYDDELMTGGTFKGEKFDADITFDYDGNGNVKKIHWVFSFGDTQTYTFEYEKIG
jgi:YD repeat-containing protein